MYEAVVNILGECGSRLKMLMRVRPFYSIRASIGLYKCHILCFIESGTPAYYHAAPSILNMLDSVQNDFLEVIGISKREALIHFNLAPFNSRRDIAMLGVLHKVVLGVAPAPFFSLHPPQAIHNNIIIELRETSNANLEFHLLLAVLAKLEGDVEKLTHLELPLFQLAIYCTP